MAHDLTANGFDQYGSLEVGHILKSIRGGHGVDFDQVYRPRTTKDDPTISFRYPAPLAEAMTRSIRQLDHLYLYTSDFGIDWVSKGLMYCAARDPELQPLISGAILKAQDDAEQADIDAMDTFIHDAEKRLQWSEGPEHRNRIRSRLCDGLETCKARGHLRKAEKIRQLLVDYPPLGID